MGDFSTALRNVSAGGGEGPVLVVSSNGVFRLIASQLASNLASTKVATGAVSLLLHHGNEAAKVLCWNVPPQNLRSYLDRGERPDGAPDESTVAADDAKSLSSPD